MYQFLRGFRIFPGSNGVIIIDWKKPQEGLDIDLVLAFHQLLSEVGTLFAASYSAGRTDGTLRYREGCRLL